MRLDVLRLDPVHGWTIPRPPPDDGRETLVLAFGARELSSRPDVWKALVQAYPRAILAGCSTAGEVFDATVSDGSVSVAVLRFEHSMVRLAYAAVDRVEESFDAGRSLARELWAQDLRAVLVLSDGLRTNGSELTRGLSDVLPAGVQVFGGLAGDGPRFRETWILKDGKPASGWVSAVGLRGERVRVRHGSAGGWDVFGPQRRVTRSRGPVLYELDGKPALALYREYLGDFAGHMPAAALRFPLALCAGDDGRRPLVRTVLSVDEPSQSMTFAGDVPQGCLAQFMQGNYHRLVADAGRAAASIGSRPGEPPGLALVVSCVGRRLLLGERTEEELEAVREALPPGTRMVGFYSYAEIAPSPDGFCDLHNQSLTLATISES